MSKAIESDYVEVLGTTPYVEGSIPAAKANMDWAFKTAMEHDKHLDFHLDYNLNPDQEAWTWYVIEQARNHKISWNGARTIALGHCTRLTLLDQQSWFTLAGETAGLPLYFVGLPTSDMYMRGKPDEDQGGGERVRGTLQIPYMIQKYNHQEPSQSTTSAMHLFPQGSCDPLSLASIGVGLYHAGTKADSQLLYDCVSIGAKKLSGGLIRHSPSVPVQILCCSIWARVMVRCHNKEGGGPCRTSSMILQRKEKPCFAVISSLFDRYSILSNLS